MMAPSAESQDKPLFIPLKRPYYEAFRNRSKTTEYRPLDSRWNEQTCWVGRPVLLSLGQGGDHHLPGVITGFHRSTRASATKPWIACYGPGKRLVACIKILITAPAATCAKALGGCTHAEEGLCRLVGACPFQVWHDDKAVAHE